MKEGHAREELSSIKGYQLGSVLGRSMFSGGGGGTQKGDANQKGQKFTERGGRVDREGPEGFDEDVRNHRDSKETLRTAVSGLRI